MWSQFKKELKNYFDHPTAYILLVAFLVINSFFFFRVALIQKVATLWPMFDLLPWIFLLLVPALTMRMVAEEKKGNTLDLLLAQPLSTLDVLLGKFLASFAFISLALMFTLPVGIVLATAGKFDWGQIFAQYVAAIFLASALTSIGIFASTITKNQVVSFIISVAISFFLILAGSEIVLIGLTGLGRDILMSLSLSAHYSNILRGVIDLRDVIYFLSIVLSFLALAYVILARLTMHHKGNEYRQLKLGTLFLIGLTIVVNLLGARIGGRWDFTQSQLYTLAPASKTFLSNVNDIVTIKLFSSEVLPSSINTTARDVKDVIMDFSRESRGNVNYEFVTVKTNNSAQEQEAQSYGVAPVQFNTVDAGQFTAQKGFFGLAVVYADQKESIPYINDTSDLEYQLISFIKKLTVKDKKTIAFLTGHGEKDSSKDYGAWRKELEKQYTLEDLDLSAKDKQIGAEVDTLIIGGPTKEVPKAELDKITGFIDKGGKALLLIDAVSVDTTTLSASLNANSLAGLAEKYGVKVNSDLAFDVKSNENVTLTGGFLQFMLPYPFWMRVPGVEGNPILNKDTSVVLPWASTLSVLKDKLGGYEAREILKSTQFGSRQEQPFMINPQGNLQVNKNNLGEQLMGVALLPGKNSQAKGRLMVIGSSTLFTDQFVGNQGGAGNFVLGLNSVDWLVQDETLISIRSKNRTPNNLVFDTPTKANIAQMLNVIGVPLLLIIYGVFRMLKRRWKSQASYA